MAKFCGNCGFQNEDRDRICGNCGARLEMPEPEPEGELPGEAPDPGKAKPALKKWLSVIGAAVLALIVLIVGVKIVSSVTGYKGAVGKVMKAYEKGDAEALVDMSSRMILADGYNEIAEYRYQITIDSALDSFDSNIGGKYKIKYEITGKTKLSERQAQKQLEELVRSGLIRQEDVEDVKGMVLVDVKVTAKRGSKSVSRTQQILLSKEKGGWKLFSLS